MIASGSKPSSIKLSLLLPNLEISLLAACISLFINYIIGKPGGEFSPYEIFSGYTVWLSTWKLKRLGNYGAYESQFDFKSARSYAQMLELRKDAGRIIYNAAEPFFTWERAVGMCMVCTGFWLSLAVGLIFTRELLPLIEIIVFSHLLIRLFSKYL